MSQEHDINRLASSARDGNVQAFEELARMMTPILFAFFRKRGGDAKELAQQTWFRVADRFIAYDPERSFKTWLLAIAYREWVNELRRKGRTAAMLVEELAVAPTESEDAMAETIQRLRDCVAKLPDIEREILFLRHWEDLSLESVGQRLEMDYSRLKGIAYRSVVKLRKCMGIAG